MNKDKSIKDLKQYNDKIKMQLEYAKIRVYNLEYEKERLNNIINKAIEYIEHAQNYGTMAQVMPHLKPYVNGDDLLIILKGEKDGEI